jgi:hypothetical protein
MLPLPAILFLLPLGVALIATATARWPRVTVGLGLVAAVVVAILALAAGRGVDGPVVSEWVVAGRVFELSRFTARTLGLLSLGTAVLFGWGWLRRAPRALVPGGLAALSFLAAALMVRPFAFGAVFLLAAVAAVVPALYDGRPAASRAAWLAFLAAALALPLLIGAGWLLDAGQAQSETATTALLPAALLLLGGFPFFVWVSAVARAAPLSAVALLLGVVNTGTAVWLAAVLDQFPATRGAAVYQAAVSGSALLSAAIGAFLVWRATGWREWLAGLLVVDAGLQVAALLAPGTPAVLAVGGLGRLLALLVIMTVVGEASAIPGRWSRWRSVAAAYGGLALLGLPLTLAFAGRWAAMIALAGYSPFVAALVLVAVGLAAAAAVRFAMSPDADGAPPAAAAGPTAATLTATLLLITALLMGLLSPLLLQFLARLATGT